VSSTKPRKRCKRIRQFRDTVDIVPPFRTVGTYVERTVSIVKGGVLFIFRLSFSLWSGTSPGRFFPSKAEEDKIGVVDSWCNLNNNISSALAVLSDDFIAMAKKGDWGERRADWMKWGGGFVVFIVCLFVTWQIAAQYGEYRGYEKSQTKSSAKHNSESVDRACAGFSGPELVRCRYEVHVRSEQAKTTEHDLQAQREVALYTYWVMWAGGGALLLTIAGLYFFAANLDEMKQARLLGELDRRAWITVEIEEVEVLLSAHPEGISFKWEYTLNNAGKSVALDVDVVVKTFKSDFWFAHNHASDHFERTIAASRKPNSGNPIFPSEPKQYNGAQALRVIDVFGAPNDATYIFVALVVLYRTDGSDVTHKTIGIYETTPAIMEDTGKSIFLRVKQKHT
jgi:hypothetical protein